MIPTRISTQACARRASRSLGPDAVADVGSEVVIPPQAKAVAAIDRLQIEVFLDLHYASFHDVAVYV